MSRFAALKKLAERLIAPLRSGDVHVYLKYARGAGGIGNSWSSSAAQTEYTYVLTNESIPVDSTPVDPSTGPYARWCGYSLRCLQE